MFQLMQVVMPANKSKGRERKGITEPEPQMDIGGMNYTESDVKRRSKDEPDDWIEVSGKQTKVPELDAAEEPVPV